MLILNSQKEKLRKQSQGFPGGSLVQTPPAIAGDRGSHSSVLAWEIPWAEESSSVLAWEIPWAEESSGLHPWDPKKSDTTERAHTHTV